MKAGVLIVEDSPAVCERLAELVTECGLFVAAIADTEDDAIKACAGCTFAAAIVDLQLAQGTGFAVIRAVRAAKYPCSVIVFTGHAVPALKVACFEAGADYFMDKAKDFMALGDLLREIGQLAAA